MSRGDQIEKDLLKAARWAQRLAERARRRTDRQAERAKAAAYLAEKLAKRVADSVTQGPEADAYAGENLADGDRPAREHRSRRRSRSASYRQNSVHESSRHGRGLYRDPDRKRIGGVCAGVAEYLGVAVRRVRLWAVLGLIFIPQITVTGYFIAYFLMEKKPYYRRVTDRFDRDAGSVPNDAAQDDDGDEAYMDESAGSADLARSRMGSRYANSRGYGTAPMAHAAALRLARGKFADLEERVRAMESHVTSSGFELQRELNKISREGTA